MKIERRYTHGYGMPLQLEDDVFILIARVMIKVGGQQYSLPEGIRDLSPKATPLSPNGGDGRQNFIPQLEGAFPSCRGS